MISMLSSMVIATGLLWTSTALAANITTAADVYTSSDLGISFALNVPTDSDDLFFSLEGPGDGSWLAIGWGSDRMANALMMIVYPTSNGSYVTVSPRLGTGHTEPTIASNVTVHLLAGSGVQTDVKNNTLAVKARCTNCRSWSGGSLDVTSKTQKMIFAYGPWVGNPDSDGADLRMHSMDGVFTMDMTKAAGPGGIPDIPNGFNVGATEVSISSTHDIAAPIHACIMVFTFVGLMPLGALILRVLGWTRLHGVNQILASILGIIGAGIGIYIGTWYNRSKKFNSGHQIFGIIIIVAMVVQLILGIMHHRIYEQTQQATKFAPVHVWLGRVVIICGVANGFLGFPLALASHYNYILLGFVLLAGIPTCLILFWKARRTARKARDANNNGGVESPKLFASEAFGTNIRMESMGNPSHYGQPAVEPWSRF